MLQKTFNLLKKQGGYGLSWARGFKFGDRFIKIVLNFEIKLFCHCLVAFGLEKNFCRLLIGTPIVF